MTNWINSEFLENTIDDCNVMTQNFLTTFMVMKEGEGNRKRSVGS